MTDPVTPPIILWDTLKLSAEPLRGRGDILVVAQVKVRKTGQNGSDKYRINFELNRHHGLVSDDTELLVATAGADGPLWRYSGRRDLVLAVKDHFLATQLYAHVAGQLGWIRAPSVELILQPGIAAMSSSFAPVTFTGALLMAPAPHRPVLDRFN